MAASYPERMSSKLRFAILATYGALWMTGCHWLALHYFFGTSSDFGPVQNPWAPAVLRVHGWIAVISVYLLGWLTASHIMERWPNTIRRASGIAIASLAFVLVVTGYALYYTTDRLHDAAGFVHEVLGVAAIAFALAHWRRYRVARRSRLLAE